MSTETQLPDMFQSSLIWQFQETFCHFKAYDNKKGLYVTSIEDDFIKEFTKTGKEKSLIDALPKLQALE